MRIVVLAGGIGGARFLRGLKAAEPQADITVVGNTGDDIHLFGLKVCPDLDTVMYTLGEGINDEQGWGRRDETWSIREEMAAYGVEPTWFGLGDRDYATHIVRTQMMGAGYPLSAVTEALCARWKPGVRLIPMSDDRVETHVVVDTAELADAVAGDRPGTRKAIHFQEYWVKLRAAPTAYAIVPVGIEEAKPAPGVLAAIAEADVILFPPSNPVVSIGTILGVPGIRDALVEAEAPVVGLSPIVGGAPVRGMADKVLDAVGVETSAVAVAKHYGPGLLDGWLVDSTDADSVAAVEEAGIPCRAIPLMMTDVEATAAMARAALDMAAEVRAEGGV
ncbi:2-phospho-L-lactate transferase [Streptodolium elevatio]|uniref:2-phospho-L-lactate transferase n=1 Tax=Streptodolium elevatio TaxID=3157996 RepID=A0ABV3DFQ8_9ACTN